MLRDIRKMLLKKLLLFIILTILLSSLVISAEICEVSEVKNKLKSVLYTFLTTSSAPIGVEEIKELLIFYLAIEGGAITTECSDEIITIMIQVGDITLPTCSNGIEYGECSSQRPEYCYAGNLIERCNICGCDNSGDEPFCDYNTNQCAGSSDYIECNVDANCGSNDYIGGESCSGNSITRDYIEYNCSTPNTEASDCTDSTTPVLQEICEFGCDNINNICYTVACVDGQVEDDGACIDTAAFLEGSGTSGDPYIIYNCLQLQNMESELSAHYELGRDIDCFDTINWNGGEGFDPVGTFTGSLDGNNYEISDLYINRPGENNIGLFGISDTDYNIGIRNLGMVDSDITGDRYVGGIAGYSYDGQIINVYNTGSVLGGSHVGGIVGYTQDLIENSYNTGSITGSGNSIGGIAGENNAVPITNSYNEGEINGGSTVGGIAGYNNAGIHSSRNTGSVSGDNTVGGIAGSSWMPSSNIYNTGDVNGGSYVGGIFGDLYVDLTNAYNTGSVTGDSYVGGIFAGWGSSSNSYNTGSVTGNSNVGGIFAGDGYSSNSYYLDSICGDCDNSNGEALTDGEMKTKDSYLPEWDFDTIWNIGSSYPFLR